MWLISLRNTIRDQWDILLKWISINTFKNLISSTITLHFKKLLFICLFNFCRAGSLLLCMGFLYLRRAGAALHCGAWASHCRGFSCCGAQALGRTCFRSYGLWAQWLQSVGSRVQVTQPVGSSKGRDRTHVSCVGRQILNHWTTREVWMYNHQCLTRIS